MKIKDIVEARMSAAVKLQRAFEREQSKSTASKERADQAKGEFEKTWKAKQEKEKQGVAEGSLNEFAQGNGGDDGEAFNPGLAKMAQEHGFTKGVSLADGASLATAFKITEWDQQFGGLYKQHFVQGFKKGRMDKINHNNKQYNLNLKLMKDGSIIRGEQGVAEAPDSDFIGFMNKTMGTRQDKAVTKYNPKTTMSMKNMPGYRKAFKFGMDVIKKMDPDTKKQFAEERDDAFFSYMMNIAEKKGYVPEHFMSEDLDEVTGEFEEIFSDPDMEGWSWSDLLRDMIGMPVKADAKANVQAHKAQMAKSQQKAAAGPDPIDPKKLDVVNRTGSSTYEIWYPSGDFYGTSTWEVIEKGFKDEDAANNRIAQLQKDPDVVKKIKAAMDQKDVSEGIDELARVLELSGLNITADEQFDIIEEMVESLALEHGVDAETIWEEFESVDDHELFEAAAWQKKSGKSKTGGLNAKGVASYRRENPGSKLQMAVTTKPSKLKPGSKAAKRRKSFCARMGGNKGPMKKPNGKPTRKALALRKWNC